MHRRVIFRVNGNQFIGYGHLIRSIALAEKLLNAFEIVFVCNQPDDFVKQQSLLKDCIIELRETAQFTPDDPRSREEIDFDLGTIATSKDIVVLDGYRFGPKYRNEIKKI